MAILIVPWCGHRHGFSPDGRLVYASYGGLAWRLDGGPPVTFPEEGRQATTCWTADGWWTWSYAGLHTTQLTMSDDPWAPRETLFLPASSGWRRSEQPARRGRELWVPGWTGHRSGAPRRNEASFLVASRGAARVERPGWSEETIDELRWIGDQLHVLARSHGGTWMAGVTDAELAEPAWVPLEGQHHGSVALDPTDGRRAVTLIAGEVRQVATHTGRTCWARPMAIEHLARPVWSPDGSRIIVGAGTRFYLLDARSGKVLGQRAVAFPRPRVQRVVWDAGWSPDGRHVALGFINDLEVWRVEDLEDGRVQPDPAVIAAAPPDRPLDPLLRQRGTTASPG